MDARRIVRTPVSSAPTRYTKSTRIDRKPRSQQTLRVTPDKSACGKFAKIDTDECSSQCFNADKSQGRFRRITDFDRNAFACWSR